jgi:hypothetical protein
MDLSKYASDRPKSWFKWEDPTIFIWSVQWMRHRNVVLVILMSVFAHIMVPLYFYIPLLVCGFLFPTFIFWIGLALTIFVLLQFILIHLFDISLLSIRVKKKTGKDKAVVRLRHIRYKHIFATFVCVGFSFIFVTPESYVQSWFQSPTNIDVKAGLLYLVDNFLHVILLGVPEIFDKHISKIKPVTWQARLFISILRVLLAIGFIETILMVFRTMRTRSDQFTGTIKEFYEKFICYPHCVALIVQCEGRVDNKRMFQCRFIDLMYCFDEKYKNDIKRRA